MLRTPGVKSKLSDEEWDQLWENYLTQPTANVHDLCEKAGVTKQGFYKHFASKIKRRKAFLKAQASEQNKAPSPGMDSSGPSTSEA